MGRVVIVLLLALGALAQADEDVRVQAEAHRAQAEALVKEGKFDDARGEFEKARAHFLQAKDAPSAATTLARIGELLQQRHAYVDAVEVFRRYYDEQSAIHAGGDHPDVADGLAELASCLQTAGRMSEALPFHEQSLAMRQRVWTGDHRDVAMSLNNVAACQAGLGRPAAALRLFEESLAMRRRLCNGDDPDVALAIGNVGYCLSLLGRADDALVRAQESLAMYVRMFPGDHVRVAMGLNSVASSLRSLGHDGDALPAYAESLAMLRRLFDGDHPYVALALSTLGTCLQELGRAGEALPLFEESVAIRRRLFPGDHPDVAKGLNGVGYCLQTLGRPGDALRFQEEGLAMIRRIFAVDHEDVAACSTNLAICLRDLGRSGEALPLFEESLAMYRRLFQGDHHLVALGLCNVASCLVGRGRAGDALPLHRESLAMKRRIFKKDHPSVAVGVNNVAYCLRVLGREADALPFYEESLEMTRRLFGDDHPDVVIALGNLACCLDRLGRTREALANYEMAVELARRLCHPGRYGALANLGDALLAAGEPSRASAVLEEAVEEIERRRAEAVGLTESDRAAYFAELKRSRAYESMVRAKRAAGDDTDALRYLERARARSLLDLLDRSRFDPLAEVRTQAEERGDRELLAAIEEVSGGIGRVEAEVGRRTYEIAALRPTGKETKERRAAIGKATDELAAARQAEQEVLRRRARLIGAQLRVAQSADAAALQRLAGPDGRLLVYSVGEEGTVLFVVPPAGSVIRAMDLSWPDGKKVTAKSLAERVEEHVLRIGQGRGGARGVVTPERQGGSWDAGRALFDALVPGDVWADVRKAKVVHVVADGALQRLAFESLPIGDAFWIDEGPPVVYGPSGSALLWSREQGDRQRSQGRLDEVVVLGDPVFARDVAAPPAGVVVVAVTDDGQAKRVGIAAGDAIVAYGAKEIATPEALGRAIKEGSGEPIVALWRDGERREVKVAPGPLGVQLSREPVADALQRLRAADPILMRASAERSGALSRYGELVPLPGTRREAEAIAKALGSPGPPPIKVTMLLGEDATAPNLRRAAPRARYLHIATHGLADETEFASYSSLALTLPRTPTAEDDGFLSLADVLAGWRGALARCELVVLSACETQRGYEQRDEGVYALPVGFLYAGAPSVIGSLWRVDDASTAELFADFYARLRGSGGRDKLVAFTEARKALKKKHPEPYFWAPFVYVGDPR